MPSNPNTPQPKPFLRIIGIIQDEQGRQLRASVTLPPEVDADEIGHAIVSVVTVLGYDPHEVAEAVHEACEDDGDDIPDFLK